MEKFDRAVNIVPNWHDRVGHAQPFRKNLERLVVEALSPRVKERLA